MVCKVLHSPTAPILFKFPRKRPKLGSKTIPFCCSSFSSLDSQTQKTPTAETQVPKSDTFTVDFKTLGSCKLGISRYPDFEYDASGGTGTGSAMGVLSEGGEVSVSFDVDTLYIPPLTTETTKFLGLPLPPFLKIDIAPEFFRGNINRESGKCEKSGCAGDKCFQHCKFSSDGKPVDGPWYLQEPLYLRWKQWDCQSDCRYHCMLAREEERRNLGDKPVKYHGKWPFRRVYGIQEPVAVALSTLNLAVQFHGWISFFILLYYKLPLRPNKKTYYEYTGLWHIYGILAMNSWFWSATFRSRHVELTEKLDYSSAVAFLGFSLIVAILRAFNVRDEAVKVMVAAPVISFVTTHILYLNFFKLDCGLNAKVCLTMGIAQLLIWAVWAGLTRHPSQWKLWVLVSGSALMMLLEIFDFPPYRGYVDAHALQLATSIPLSYFWWSFARDDAEFRTSALLKKVK